MKKLSHILFLLLGSLHASAQNNRHTAPTDAGFLNATKTWFAAWQLTSAEIFKIREVKPVDFVFFDDRYVYSTSEITVENGTTVKGNNLMNLKLKWKKANHRDTLTLPDRSRVPVTLMSFAGAVPNQPGRAFFVMPLPGFWKKAGVTSKELSTGNLITGVFLHEFSHSQQMQNFGKTITHFENTTDFGVPFSDDIVQDLFEKDTAYANAYNQEVALFYACSKNRGNKKILVEALNRLEKRQQDFFRGKHSALKEIDNLFLTMEGLGQYAMYRWLIHPKGANIKIATAIEGVRRKKNRWSQDEGFALFLILDKLTNPANWAKEMFGDKTEDVRSLINKWSR